MNPFELWSKGEAPSGAFAAERFKDRAQREKSRDFGRTIRRRDFVESATAAVLSAIFATIGWRTESYYVRLGAVIVLLSCFVIVSVLTWARRRTRPELDLAAYARSLRLQGRLLCWAWLWYVSPAALGVMLVALSKQLATGAWSPADVIFAAWNALFFAGLAWINYVGGRKLLAQADELHGGNASI